LRDAAARFRNPFSHPMLIVVKASGGNFTKIATADLDWIFERRCYDLEIVIVTPVNAITGATSAEDIMTRILTTF
jgi:hypothetical protein